MSVKKNLPDFEFVYESYGCFKEGTRNQGLVATDSQTKCKPRAI
uniref:Uncharacterized protein n=1 Tax=Arundo donax TaxID=35708 RepID=A0A0A9AM18_ARUDO